MNAEEKNTAENKARFFAQYWDQQVCWIADDLPLQTLDRVMIYANPSYLLLTPLSMISDEDAVEVAGVYNIKAKRKFIVKSSTEIIIGTSDTSDTPYIRMSTDGKMLVADWTTFSEMPTIKILECYDHLRSKGYALPFMGISVEDQIKFGWIKLRDINN